jgi:hypothetical protein
MSHYVIQSTTAAPNLFGEFDDPSWTKAGIIEVSHFHPAGSDHKPVVRCRVLHDASHLYFLWEVKDQYVLCKHTEYLQDVWRDSCVEFFVQPKADKGYFNFEINCGGAMLCYYIEDPTRTPAGFVKFTKIPAELGQGVRRFPTMPQTVVPERVDPVTWRMGYAIPLSLLEHFVGKLGPLAGQSWRGNFYKCADDCSHPHWGSWASIGTELNFHQPKKFGILEFGK